MASKSRPCLAKRFFNNETSPLEENRGIERAESANFSNANTQLESVIIPYNVRRTDY